MGPNKRAFTLFELLLVILLVAVAFGACAFPVSRAIGKERFQKGVDEVISRLVLAQELMLDFHTDITVKLEQTDEGLECTLTTHRLLPIPIENALKRHKALSAITGFAFDEGSRELVFESSLGTTPKGVLTLFGKGYEERVTLKGFPSRIKRGIDALQTPQAASYPEEILSLI